MLKGVNGWAGPPAGCKNSLEVGVHIHGDGVGCGGLLSSSERGIVFLPIKPQPLSLSLIFL